MLSFGHIGGMSSAEAHQARIRVHWEGSCACVEKAWSPGMHTKTVLLCLGDVRAGQLASRQHQRQGLVAHMAQER